jgi:hypothetical protein
MGWDAVILITRTALSAEQMSPALYCQTDRVGRDETGYVRHHMITDTAKRDAPSSRRRANAIVLEAEEPA